MAADHRAVTANAQSQASINLALLSDVIDGFWTPAYVQVMTVPFIFGLLVVALLVGAFVISLHAGRR